MRAGKKDWNSKEVFSRCIALFRVLKTAGSATSRCTFKLMPTVVNSLSSYHVLATKSHAMKLKHVAAEQGPFVNLFGLHFEDALHLSAYCAASSYRA